MSNGVNQNCNITNNSGKKAVVLNAFNSPANVTNNSTQQGYLQELQLLTFTGGTSQVLDNGASGTVVLDETYTDSHGQTRESFLYDLLISAPTTFYPIMAVGEALSFSTMSYPDITITQAAASNMDKALNFCQNIMTAPSSNMATSFQSTMTAAFQKGTVQESEQVIADFFNQFDAFKGLDFGSYVAVSTWMRGFAYEWGMNGQGQPGQTYYLYSAPGDQQTGAQSEGTITFTQKPNVSSPGDPTDRNSGFIIAFKDNNGGTATPLTFNNGQLIDSPGGAIALNCSFGYAGTFTGKADTTVWQVLSGTLLNKKVIAIPLAPESGWSKFWSSLTFGKVFGYFMEAMGLWMALDFLKQKLTAKDKKLENDRTNENQGGDPSPEQQQEAQQAGDDVGQAAAQQDQQLADRAAGDGNVHVPQNDAEFSEAVNQSRADGSEAFNDVASDNISGGIDSAGIQLEDLAQIEVTPAMEEAESNLIDAKSSLSEGDLSAANDSLQSVTEALPEIVQELGDQVSQELKEQIEDAVEVQKEASEVAEETDENSDATESGDEDVFDDAVIPE